MLHTDGTATLFVSGTAYELEGDLAFAAPLITGTALLHAATLQPHLNNSAFVELLTTLVNAGELEVDEG
jgi:50S ribosomal protein L16 3-hydroxylase